VRSLQSRNRRHYVMLVSSRNSSLAIRSLWIRLYILRPLVHPSEIATVQVGEILSRARRHRRIMWALEPYRDLIGHELSRESRKISRIASVCILACRIWLLASILFDCSQDFLLHYLCGMSLEFDFSFRWFPFPDWTLSIRDSLTAPTASSFCGREWIDSFMSFPF